VNMAGNRRKERVSRGLNSSSMVTGSSASLTRAHFLERSPTHALRGIP
jgi:hypothetical protein